MKIWVDGDACPKVIKEVLLRAAERAKVRMTFVANQYLTLPLSDNISFLQVEAGFDVADKKIVELCDTGDLVITADIPLAAEAIEKGASALNPRGQLYNANNIAPILSARNYMNSMRSGLVENNTGPAIFTAKDREVFANELDKYIRKNHVGQ